ncbi:hypothetical protein [Streptomyces sp. CBMA156]|uniref:hypothetical protein n=1 Tax=Streptomyces sp. CBMA156 TaxID=1930280 RepID=UPI001661FF7C|nr:hypothetical protein [Streptomyces sp. CBMA156]MBD0671659.1 hypothetical protein [Streptomyces sp. CBMA156]
MEKPHHHQDIQGDAPDRQTTPQDAGPGPAPDAEDRGAARPGDTEATTSTTWTTRAPSRADVLGGGVAGLIVLWLLVCPFADAGGFSCLMM